MLLNKNYDELMEPLTATISFYTNSSSCLSPESYGLLVKHRLSFSLKKHIIKHEDENDEVAAFIRLRRLQIIPHCFCVDKKFIYCGWLNSIDKPTYYFAVLDMYKLKFIRYFKAVCGPSPDVDEKYIPHFAFIGDGKFIAVHAVENHGFDVNTFDLNGVYLNSSWIGFNLFQLLRKYNEHLESFIATIESNYGERFKDFFQAVKRYWSKEAQSPITRDSDHICVDHERKETLFRAENKKLCIHVHDTDQVIYVCDQELWQFAYYRDDGAIILFDCANECINVIQ